ncbi:MAG: hypothetical protein ACJAQX_002560 [Polaribacter sp.]|jgi:hypothetical protein
MNKSGKIVRTKTTTGNKNKPNEMYYEIDFITFKEYVSKLGKHNAFIYEGKPQFDLYPYKWYDFRKFYQIPAYWFLLRIFRNSPERINKQTHNKASIITLITEILFLIKPVVEFIESTVKMFG